MHFKRINAPEIASFSTYFKLKNDEWKTNKRRLRRHTPYSIYTRGTEFRTLHGILAYIFCNCILRAFFVFQRYLRVLCTDVQSRQNQKMIPLIEIDKKSEVLSILK